MSNPPSSHPLLFFFNGEAVNIHLYTGYNSSKQLLFWKTAAVWVRQYCPFLELLGSSEGQRNLQGWLCSSRTLVQCPRIGTSARLTGNAPRANSSPDFCFHVDQKLASVCICCLYKPLCQRRGTLWFAVMWPHCAVTCNAGRSIRARRPVSHMRDGVLFIISLATCLIS